MIDAPVLGDITAVESIRTFFSERGFKFTEGKLGQHPRCFGLAKGCTLELVGESDVVSATMVGVIAPDKLELARLNAIRMTALMALLVGEQGAVWISSAMKQANTNRLQEQAIEGALDGYKLRLVVNRKKSTMTLSARSQKPRGFSDVAGLTLGLIEKRDEAEPTNEA